MTDPGAKEPDSAVKTVLSVVTSIGVPITVLSALMFYFGWARADEQARYMGLDVSLFGYTAQDYVMRSISTLFMPLLALGILGLAWLGLHQAIQNWLAMPQALAWLRIAGRVAFGVGLLTASAGFLAAVAHRLAGPLVAPLALAAGTAVAGYGLWLARAAGPPSSRRHLPLGQRALRMFFVAGIVSLAMIWELSSYAAVVGRSYALYMAQTVSYMPRATALSAKPLSIEAPGVQEQRIGTDPPVFRTTGLRLLCSSGGRLFLLHDGWYPGRGSVVVLPDGGDISWHFSR